MINASDTATFFFEKETKLYWNHFDIYLHNNAAWTSNSWLFSVLKDILSAEETNINLIFFGIHALLGVCAPLQQNPKFRKPLIIITKHFLNLRGLFQQADVLSMQIKTYELCKMYELKYIIIHLKYKK